MFQQTHQTLQHIWLCTSHSREPVWDGTKILHYTNVVHLFHCFFTSSSETYDNTPHSICFICLCLTFLLSRSRGIHSWHSCLAMCSCIHEHFPALFLWDAGPRSNFYLSYLTTFPWFTVKDVRQQDKTLLLHLGLVPVFSKHLVIQHAKQSISHPCKLALCGFFVTCNHCKKAVWIMHIVCLHLTQKNYRKCFERSRDLQTGNISRGEDSVGHV